MPNVQKLKKSSAFLLPESLIPARHEHCEFREIEFVFDPARGILPSFFKAMAFPIRTTS
jgi:hypothetical protein